MLGSPALRDIAQCRSLDSVLQLLRGGKQPAPPDVIAGCGANVLKRSIGERRPAVATGAMRFAVEQSKAALGFRWNRVLVSQDPAINRRFARDNGALVGRDRQFNSPPRDLLVAEGLSEGLRVARQGAQPPHQFALGDVHDM